MKIINNSPRNYIAYETILEAGKILEIEDEQTLEILLKQEGVEEYINPEEIKQLKEELKQIKEEPEKPKEEIKEEPKKTQSKKSKK